MAESASLLSTERTLADDLEGIGVVDVHCHRHALIFKICKVIHDGRRTLEVLKIVYDAHFSTKSFNRPNLLELQGHLKILGDIHGHYSDLLRFFEHGGFPPNANYVFLGNYVDHGKQSLETICLLLAYKIKFPENFFLLRGNHQCASMNRIYGFYDECKRGMTVRVWKDFIDCFNCLPVAALLERNILCMHGGLSPKLTNLDQIRGLPRPSDVPDCGLLHDLLWSDPDKDVKGWEMRDRGAFYTLGPDTLSKFLKKQDTDLICRGHQVNDMLMLSSFGL